VITPPEDLAHVTRTYVSPMTEETQGTIKARNGSSTGEELYAWTMRREAVASCLVEDIFHLRPNSAKSESPGLVLAI
jgi:hypothetical protein